MISVGLRKLATLAQTKEKNIPGGCLGPGFHWGVSCHGWLLVHANWGLNANHWNPNGSGRYPVSCGIGW